MALLRRQWFLVALAAVLGGGMTLHESLEPFASRFPRGALVAIVMFLTALPLEFRQFTSTIRKWQGLALALALNVVAAPLAAYLLRGTLPAQLAVGLVVACSVPCTLASAAVWTRRGGGNDALALCVTMITNLACFVVMPATLAWLLATSITLPLTAEELSWRLTRLVLLPIVAAQVIRQMPHAAAWAATAKASLATACQFGILTMVLIGAVSAGETLASIDATSYAWWQIPTLVVVVTVLHLGLFFSGWWGARLLGIDTRDAIAIAIAGSQKTLTVGLDVALSFGGLAILPMVAYHVAQLLLDTILVDRLRRPGGGQAPPDASDGA